ncbi:MAG: LamG-like jellyroll fold domain-containing protein [Flavobacteriales bacterium]
MKNITLLSFSFFLSLLGYSQTTTKISLFRQTTAFDSIVAKKDSLIFYNIDSTHKAYLPYEIDSVKYENDSIKIFQGNILVKEKLTLDNCFNVSQTSHGLSVPSWGILPLKYNHGSNQYDLASADTISNVSDILMVLNVDGNTFKVQNTGYLNLTHGLDVGYWYYLGETPGTIAREDTILPCKGIGSAVQRLFFVSSSNKILLQPEEPYSCESCAVNEVTKSSLIGQWNLNEGSGNVLNDVINGYTLTELSTGGSAFNWNSTALPTGIEPTAANVGFFASTANSNTINSSLMNTNEFTIEFCTNTPNNTQGGPTRFITSSLGTGARNFTIGMNGGNYVIRLRTSVVTSANGTPDLILGPITTNQNIYHTIVRKTNGELEYYENGILISSQVRTGNFSGWNNSSYLFGILNETTLDRQSITKLNFLTIYNRALSLNEILDNYRLNECNPSVIIDCECCD